VSPTIFAAPLTLPKIDKADTAKPTKTRTLTFRPLQFSATVSPTIFAAPLTLPKIDKVDTAKPTKTRTLTFRPLQFSTTVSPTIFAAPLSIATIVAISKQKERADNAWHTLIKVCNPASVRMAPKITSVEVVVPYDGMVNDCNGSAELVLLDEIGMVQLCETVPTSHGMPVTVKRRGLEKF